MDINCGTLQLDLGFCIMSSPVQGMFFLHLSQDTGKLALCPIENWDLVQILIACEFSKPSVK